MSGSIMIEIRLEDEAAFRLAHAALRDSPPEGLGDVLVEDRSSMGAFDTEWILAVALGLPIGALGSMVAAWLVHRLSLLPTTTRVIVVIRDETIDLGDPDARQRITALVDAAEAARKD